MLNLASVESRSILRRGAGGYKGDQDIVLDLKELDILRGKTTVTLGTMPERYK